MATPTPKREPTVEELLKKVREDVERMVKEGESISSSASQALQQLAKLSDELKKLAEELKKPPKPAGPGR